MGNYTERIALEFDRHIDSTAAEVSIKFQSDWKRLNPNLAVSMFREILQWDVRPLNEWRPWLCHNIGGVSIRVISEYIMSNMYMIINNYLMFIVLN